MSSKKLDKNIVYFSFDEPKEYFKTDIYNLSIKIFEKILTLPFYIFKKGKIEDNFFIYKKKYRFVKITNIIDIYYFLTFDFGKNNEIVIKKHYYNIILFNEHELLELISFFKIVTKPSHIELVDDLEKNYKKYLNEAIIESIIK